MKMWVVPLLPAQQYRMAACPGETGDIDIGLATPMELFQSIAAEGYQMSHRRVPLSRERTPEAADLDILHQQVLVDNEGRPYSGKLASM